MKAISLFSGAGGDTVGMHNAGIDVVAFSEIDDAAAATHLANFPNCEWIKHENKADITKIPDEAFLKYDGIDLIFSGFPCQAFSHAGKKMATEDPRGKLFLEFARVTRLLKPRFIIGENVPGLLQRKVGDVEVFPTILKTFQDLGYNMSYQVLDASNFNTPQKRKRLFMVGCLDKTFQFPTRTGTVTLANIFEKSLLNAMEISTVPNDVVFAHDTSEPIEVTGSPHPFLKLNADRNTLSFAKRVSPNHAEILDPNGFSKTILCAYNFQPRLYVAMKVQNKSYVRTLTTSELGRIQGFPENYKFCGTPNQIIKQIGNAVPPNIVEAVSRVLISNL